ncbi:50S ribosomal protein L23 [Patescibacteria group bacterium]|nr:50S ribosomal protein L23 [Patescibacteria group bacterium]
MSIFSKKNTDAKPVKEEKKPIDNKEDLTLAQLEEKEDRKAKPGKKKTADKAGKGSALAYKWIRRPIITEKATYLAAENKYIFEVALNANKIEVAKAISKLYNVDVEKVNVIVNRGKRVTYGRIHGRTKRTKKAIVTLKQGQTISVYEGV